MKEREEQWEAWDRQIKCVWRGSKKPVEKTPEDVELEKALKEP